MNATRLGIFLAIIGLAAEASPAQRSKSSVLVATIAIDSSQVLLPGVEVIITDLRRITKSDIVGEATIADIPPGQHTIRVRALGYGAIDAPLLFRGDTLAATFYLKPIVTTLGTVEVSAKRVSPGLREFEGRRSLGLGRFLTESQLDSAAKTLDFQELMALRFPSMKVITVGTTDRVLVSKSDPCGGDPKRIGSGTLLNKSCIPCAVTVFLDGHDLHDTPYDLIRTWDLAGVEFYSGAQVPAEYRVHGTNCGLLLLWSRRP